MPKCKKCNRDLKEGSVSSIFVSTVWLYCMGCKEGDYYPIPAYISAQQYKRYLDAKV